MQAKSGWFKQTPPKPREPGAVMFRGLKRQLVLWYGLVLSISLIGFGVTLYLTMQGLLFSPVKEQLQLEADRLRDQWTRSANFRCPINNRLPPVVGNPPGVGGPNNRGGSVGQGQVGPDNAPLGQAGPGTLPGAGNQPLGQQPPRQEETVTIYMACLDKDGRILETGLNPNSSKFSEVPTIFLSTFLTSTVRTERSGNDIVSSNVDTVYRYMIPVRNPQIPNAPPNYLIVGRSVSDLERALHTLRDLIIGLGLISLLGTTLGGFFLAERALQPARLAFRRQQAFVADASHELGTPLTLLRSNAEVILRRRNHFAADDAELLDNIVSETEYMTKITDRMLSLAKLDSGRLILEHEVVDLSDAVERVARRVKNLAAEKNITVEVTELVPDGLVLADEQLIEQSILILADNAIKYTPAGGRLVLGCQSDESTVVVSLADNGIGIPTEQIPHLGQRFFRVDKIRARSTGGAGLGLSLAFSIVDMHQGKLVFQSALNIGTTATIILPKLKLPPKE